MCVCVCVCVCVYVRIHICMCGPDINIEIMLISFWETDEHHQDALTHILTGPLYLYIVTKEEWGKDGNKNNIDQRSPTFLAPGIGFVEDNFSMDGGVGEGMVRDPSSSPPAVWPGS